jgi:hypothetical protein
MDTLLDYAPTPKAGLNAHEWMKHRNTIADIHERYKEEPDWREKVALLRNAQAVDSWGNEFLASFNTGDDTVTLTSVGLDRTPRTGDDLVGIIRWRPVYEDGERRWSSDRSWKVPENLGEVVTKFTRGKSGIIEYTKAVQP